MQTLNQIKNRLIGYLNSHAQINQVVYGDNYKFAADRNLKYPVANCEWVESNVSGRLIGHTFRIILADRTNPNIDSIDDDIDSDMLLIADDFFAWLELQEGFILTKTSQIVKIVDEYGDRISGIRFRIVLSTVRRSNDCETPRKTSPSSPPVIHTATFLVNGESQIYSLSANVEPVVDNVITNTEQLDSVTVSFSIITDVTDSEALFSAAYNIPEGFNFENAVLNYSDYVWMYTITGTYNGLQDSTFDFTSIPGVVATFSYNGVVDTISMTVTAEYPATYDSSIGHIISLDGVITQVALTMPWLGGVNFSDDYNLPDGLTLELSFVFSDLYWEVEVGYTAVNGLVFDFVPLVSPDYTATFKLDGVLHSPGTVTTPATLLSGIVHTSTFDLVTIDEYFLPLDVSGSHVFTDKFTSPYGLTINSAFAADGLFVWVISCSYTPVVGNIDFNFISI